MADVSCSRGSRFRLAGLTAPEKQDEPDNDKNDRHENDVYYADKVGEGRSFLQLVVLDGAID